jgi:hypothetical protein
MDENTKRGGCYHSRPLGCKKTLFLAENVTLVRMPVVVGRRFAGRIISGPDGQADKQYLINPHDHPAVEEVKNQASANDCRGSKDNHNSYHSGKLHFILLYSFPLGSMMLLMPVPVALLADYVEESTNTAVVKDDNNSQQNRVKGTHKYKVYWVICPLKSKWKHDDVLPLGV